MLPKTYILGNILWYPQNVHIPYVVQYGVVLGMVGIVAWVRLPGEENAAITRDSHNHRLFILHRKRLKPSRTKPNLANIFLEFSGDAPLKYSAAFAHTVLVVRSHIYLYCVLSYPKVPFLCNSFRGNHFTAVQKFIHDSNRFRTW